jgi:WW domain-containing oxidoreductase
MSTLVDMRRFGRRATAEDVLAGIDLTGKTFLVTGAAGGLGREMVHALVSHGAHVVALARTSDAVQARERVTPVACELADLASIARAAAVVRCPLDAIIANAGVTGGKKRELIRGVERQFFVNHLGHFALVNGLVKHVRDRTGRIVIVSSSASIGQAPPEGIRFDDLDGARTYSPFTFYGQSKLANALYAIELARRLGPRGITANAVHPGAVRGTQLNRGLGCPLKAILTLAGPFMKTVEQGAATPVFVAASPHAEAITGQYWADCRVAAGSNHLADRELATRLWSVSESLIA